MVVKNESNPLDDILFVVVTCSRDRWRDKALKALIQSLNRENRKLNFAPNVLFFDNDSTYKKAFSKLEFEAKFAVSEENIGYWGALLWSLENAPRLFNREFKFVHPIESDLVMYDMEKLATAVDFLKKRPDIHCVRTQEFDVEKKQCYFKNSKSFCKVQRSLVADYNGVTEEKVSFQKVQNYPDIYVSNWHAKVPALHNYNAIFDVIKQLSKEKQVTEKLFMDFYYNISNKIGILCGGIYYAQLNNPKWMWEKMRITGSWSSQKMLDKLGYRSYKKR